MAQQIDGHGPTRRLITRVLDSRKWEPLRIHYDKWRNCQSCPLGCQPEVSNHVFYRGYIPARILFVGEAPGESENANGYPFSNPAAAGWVMDCILDLLIQQCGGLIDSWCITNTVMCMPVNRNPKKDTKFREPTFDEIKACSPRLLEFINIVQPSLIVMMGNVAEKSIRHLTNGGIGNGYLKIQHPSWMQRTGQDTDKEIKGAVLSILSRCKKLGIPGFDQPLFQ